MIGVLGGTFNPVHFGHLRPALEITEALQLREMRVIPSAMPPHREVPDVDAQLRLHMVEAAAASESRFMVDDRELRREGPSYTVDTLISLRQEVGDEAIGLLIGMDAFLDLQTWHQWERLIELAHIIVMQRPSGYSREQYRQKMDPKVRALVDSQSASQWRELHNVSSGKLWFQTVTQLDISATKIRDTIKAGYSVRFLTPDSVVEIIENHQLYR
ncbi:nicotinate-nucleotide adenylyltransferase [Kaarinaea lacus]